MNNTMYSKGATGETKSYLVSTLCFISIIYK